MPLTELGAYLVMKAAYERYRADPRAVDASWRVCDGEPYDVLKLAFKSADTEFPDSLDYAAKVVDYMLGLSCIEVCHSNKYINSSKGSTPRRMSNYRVTCALRACKTRKPEAPLAASAKASRTTSGLNTSCRFKLTMGTKTKKHKFSKHVEVLNVAIVSRACVFEHTGHAPEMHKQQALRRHSGALTRSILKNPTAVQDLQKAVSEEISYLQLKLKILRYLPEDTTTTPSMIAYIRKQIEALGTMPGVVLTGNHSLLPTRKSGNVSVTDTFEKMKQRAESAELQPANF
jgi:hypothetical protein